MKNQFLFFLFLAVTVSLTAQPSIEELTNIKIARDQWGVPHIYAPTDKEVAYGLAWVQCEDDFKTLQEQMLAIRGRYGEIAGKEGIILDFGIKFMGLREVAEAKYDTDLSPEFKEVMAHYVAGVNNYAALHPEEILLKGLFPLRGQDIIIGYLLGLEEMSGAGKDLQAILGGYVNDDEAPKGSNAIAISRNKTTDGKTYLAVNSHQPLEGWYSWYEAHLKSDEGMNILGGTFPGGVSIFHGATDNIAWAHTVNHSDRSDVYKLTMHSDMENHYLFDNHWIPLETRTYKAKLKLGFLKIPIKKTIYYSKYGPTFKTDKGYYAWRYVANMDIRAAEQWHKMGKAQNFEEFKELLSWLAIPCNNVVYADKEDNIYYLSIGKQPVRDPAYDWQGVLPGHTSKTLWTDFYPVDSLPQLLNPSSGYVFNTNNTPFSSSDAANNPKETALNKTMGYQSTGVENNRSNRFMELIAKYDKLSYEDFKTIKYDESYPDEMTQPNLVNLELVMDLEASKHLDIKDAIEVLQKWNRSTAVENKQAALFIITVGHLVKAQRKAHRFKRGNKITEQDAVVAITKAKAEMLKKYGSMEVPLGNIQRHIRGDVSLPIGGGPDVLRAMYSKRQKDGIYKGFAGESHIELIRFGADGVELETVNTYGSSAKPGKEHFTDQMEMFANKKLKVMSLDMDKAMKEAKQIYSPKKVLK